MVLRCSICKSKERVLQPLGLKSLCSKCSKNFHMTILTKLDEKKIKFMSYLEGNILSDIFFFAQDNGFKCEFQYDIIDMRVGCKLELAAERDNFDFECSSGFLEGEDCPHLHCKYHFTNSYVKYILDFALFKGELMIDLELDGMQYHKDKIEHDLDRNKYMQKMGWQVFRYNYDTVFNNREKIFKELKEVDVFWKK